MTSTRETGGELTLWRAVLWQARSDCLLQPPCGASIDKKKQWVTVTAPTFSQCLWDRQYLQASTPGLQRVCDYADVGLNQYLEHTWRHIEAYDRGMTIRVSPLFFRVLKSTRPLDLTRVRKRLNTELAYWNNHYRSKAMFWDGNRQTPNPIIETGAYSNYAEVA